jgi:hypothetical protein
MTTITVAAIKWNPKLSKLRTADGDEYGFWTNKADKLQLEEGKIYNIEVDHWSGQDGKSVPIIIKAKRVTVGGQSTAARSAPPPEPFVSGAYRANGASSAPAPAAFRTPEQMFVSEVVCAYIAAGKCEDPAKLKTAIAAIRAAFNGNWGPGADQNTFLASEAGHQHNGNGAAPH